MTTKSKPCAECGNTKGHRMFCVSGNEAAGRYQRQLDGALNADEKIELFMHDARTIADGLGFKQINQELRQVARRMVRAGWMPPRTSKRAGSADAPTGTPEKP